jgi:hypothetical protein
MFLLSGLLTAEFAEPLAYNSPPYPPSLSKRGGDQRGGEFERSLRLNMSRGNTRYTLCAMRKKETNR